MAKFLALLFFLLAVVPCSAASDSVRVYYVLQNPKYYGLKKACAWFEISGVKDKVVERKINESLRKTFYEKTHFKSGGRGYTQKDNAPTGYTDYTFNIGHTSGDGWVRFKDSDSLLRLEQANGYYGGGMCLGNFGHAVAPGKLVSFWFIRSPEDFHPTELLFSLVTGDQLPAHYYLHIDPAKKDSLERLLVRKMDKGENASLLRNCTVVKSDPLPDSMLVDPVKMSNFLDGTSPPQEALYTRSYEMTCLDALNKKAPWWAHSKLSYAESIYFFEAKDLDYLEKLYLE